MCKDTKCVQSYFGCARILSVCKDVCKDTNCVQGYCSVQGYCACARIPSMCKDITVCKDAVGVQGY